MKIVSIILTAVIALGFSIGMISTGILQTSMNIFLIPTVQFVLFACILFLVYEKRILKNVRHYYMQGLILGLLLTAFIITNALTIRYSSFLMAGIFMLIPLSIMIAPRSYMRYIAPIISLAAAIWASVVYDAFSPIVLIPGIASSAAIYFIIDYFMKNSEHIRKGLIETAFTATGLTAVIITVLFLILRPGTAAVLSPFQQIHLILLILTGTFIPYSLIIYKKCTFNYWGIAVFILIFGLTILVKSTSWFFVIAYLLLLIPYILPGGKRKAFSTVEMFALTALIGMTLSLIFPVINGIKRINTIHEDRVLIQENKNPENTICVGDIYIKYLGNKPKYIYQYSDKKFYSVPVR